MRIKRAESGQDSNINNKNQWGEQVSGPQKLGDKDIRNCIQLPAFGWHYLPGLRAVS